jgi:rhamnogalacturonyl hydrolase YesR
MSQKILNSFNTLIDFCESEQFKGHDPYDGLNSVFFNAIPFLKHNHFFRLCWIQFFKRSPFNLRSVFGVKKQYNSKALGLFLSGYCNLYTMTPSNNNLSKINFFIDKIIENIAKGYSGDCWGYNFDWEARAFSQPVNTPTIVSSSFVANALLDAYDLTKDPKLLSICRSTCDFILHDLNRTYDTNANFAFSYSPLDKTVVYNASLLGAKLLSRVYHYTNEDILILEAKKVVEFCCQRQNQNGSWSYGMLSFHHWIDNFHTGYNLECIADYMKYSLDDSYTDSLDKGFKFYIDTFFTSNGIPKYYHNSIYPIDIHSSAQLLITLSHLNKTVEYNSLIEKVLNWTIDNMQSHKGYFYYQINKHFTSKIPYMRWSQAWMFYAFSEFFLKKVPVLVKTSV